jgi:hypothetical protein
MLQARMGSQLMLTQRPLRDELASWARDYASLRAVPRQAYIKEKRKKIGAFFFNFFLCGSGAVGFASAVDAAGV